MEDFSKWYSRTVNEIQAKNNIEAELEALSKKADENYDAARARLDYILESEEDQKEYLTDFGWYNDLHEDYDDDGYYELSLLNTDYDVSTLRLEAHESSEVFGADSLHLPEDLVKQYLHEDKAKAEANKMKSYEESQAQYDRTYQVLANTVTKASNGYTLWRVL